jgi:hypothetical protein
LIGFANTGAEVPALGALILLLSVFAAILRAVLSRVESQVEGDAGVEKCAHFDPLAFA